LESAARRAVRRLVRGMSPERRARVEAVAARLHQGVVPRRIKVSVIIPTYNSSAEGLQRVMKSLRRQTLHPRATEIVFVDDGSTDDTVARLRAIAARWPNVVVHPIPNSGWASRPRNVGVTLARGEYVLFMDHDDELLPSGLERAYEFGHRHGADVVNAKEVRTSGWSWGWDAFVADVPRADYVDPNPLIPMTPHKLYRRQFLLDNQVTFIEGARILWEDIYFNTLAYARGARVAVLSRYPLYHWVIGAQNTSKTFGHDIAELWSNLVAVLDYIATELAGHPGRDALLAYHLRARALTFLGPRSLPRPPHQYAIAYARAQELVAKYGSPEGDAALPTVDRCRIELVRFGSTELQRRLAELDRGVTARPTVTDLHWEGAELVLTVRATLLQPGGEPVRFRRDGDRWRRIVPDELAAVLSDAALDITDDLARGRFRASVKGRSSRSNWPLGEPATVRCTDDGTGAGVITAEVTARFDPVRFADEHDLTDPVWDFAARLEVLGYVAHGPALGGETTVALLDGVPAVGYVNKEGRYSLDVAAAVRTVTGSAGVPVTGAQVRSSRSARGVRVAVTAALPDVHCSGSSRVRGQVLIGDRRSRAVLTGGAAGAALRFAAVVPEGTHRVKTRFLGRTGQTGLSLVVTGGRAELVRTDGAEPTPA
jgi:glycosyltransferase involved in cell wall biosynthesis